MTAKTHLGPLRDPMSTQVPLYQALDPLIRLPPMQPPLGTYGKYIASLSLSLSLSISLTVYIYIYIYIYTHVYNTHIYMYAYIHICTWAGLYSIHVQTYRHTQRSHTHTYAHLHTGRQTGPHLSEALSPSQWCCFPGGQVADRAADVSGAKRAIVYRKGS